MCWVFRGKKLRIGNVAFCPRILFCCPRIARIFLMYNRKLLLLRHIRFFNHAFNPHTILYIRVREATAAVCCIGIGHCVPNGIGANADAAGTAGAAGGAGVFRQERSGEAATGGRLPRRNGVSAKREIIRISWQSQFRVVVGQGRCARRCRLRYGKARCTVAACTRSLALCGRARH